MARNGRAALAVSESHGERRLHLGGDAIQSAMRLADPHALALDYTRCMMAFLLFHPVPRDVLMIGLGGGSLAKFFHRHFATARVRVVERDERVVAAAREHFHLPPDSARLAVEVGDGAQALAPLCCDTLVVDGFDDDDQVAGLASADFYDAAYLALKEGGVMVVNYLADDRLLDRYLVRLERSFGGAVLCMPALSDPNVIAFALKDSEERVMESMRTRAAKLEKVLGLPFGRYVKALRRMNRFDAWGLRIAGEA